MLVRDATADDLGAIRTLYNALIASTTVAWTEEPETHAARESWFTERRARGDAVVVAEIDGAVVGYASYGPFRGEGRWPGYRHTVEHSIHVAEAHHGRGIGRKLMQALSDRAMADDIHVMVGAVDGDNQASINFHERLGFEVVARMPQVGRKFDRWLDLVLMQRILDRDASSGSRPSGAPSIRTTER
ncbi:MAG: N-acetyltransferase family protein [Actinomycetota bacterium]